MYARSLRAYAHAMIASAAAWDVLGALGVLPPWWPPVSYVLAGAGAGSACLAILVGLFTSVPGPDGRRVRTEGGRRTLGQLLAIGIILAAWVLRGDAEIPPDPPLVAASVLGAVLYAAFTIRRR